MEKLLSNKNAIVTGGTRGIGRSIAKIFVEHGASVIIFGTNPDKGQEAIEEISSGLGPLQKILFYQVDVGNTIEVDEVMKKILQDWGGRVDILVNNAGVTRDNLLMRLSEEDWRQVIDTNLKSIFNTCRALARPMMKARQGKIINISSVVGLTGNAGQTNYAASKSGMIGFTKSLAKELASRNICINCIAPGFIQTEMTDVLNEEQKQAILAQIPLQRLGSVQDIANAALFLASSLADYITGQTLTVDGGMVMH
jgi:3-oxoacyl-[acyl-carrier protein] reductase